MDVSNALVDTDIPVQAYGTISNLQSMGMGSPHTHRSLTHIDCYMDGVIYTVQGEPEQKHQVFCSTVRAIKWLFPSLPVEAKNLVSVKKLLVGEGGWTCVKEFLSWIIDMDSETVALPERKLQELQYLLTIPTTQR